MQFSSVKYVFKHIGYVFSNKDVDEPWSISIHFHFNLSLAPATVLTCFKSTTIIPVSNRSPVPCLNDNRPVALTPITMKCLERAVLANIQSNIPESLDPLQYLQIHWGYYLCGSAHLENMEAYIRMLFIDYSSASSSPTNSQTNCTTLA